MSNGSSGQSERGQHRNRAIIFSFSTQGCSSGGVNVFTEGISQDFPLWCSKNKDLDFRDGVTFWPLKGKVGLVRGGFGDTRHSIEFRIPGFVIPGSLLGLHCLLHCVGWLWWIWHSKLSSPPLPSSVLSFPYFILFWGQDFSMKLMLFWNLLQSSHLSFLSATLPGMH